MTHFTKKLFNFFSLTNILKIIIIFTLFLNINCSDDNLQGQTPKFENFLVIYGTVNDINDSYTHQSLIRIDFQAAPSVTYSDGSVLNLPVSDGPSFVTALISAPMENYVISVGGIELSNTTGQTYYQSIADNGYYGVVINTVDVAAAIDAADTLLDASLIGQEIEIIIFGASP